MEENLFLDFKNAPKINGEFIFNPSNLTQTIVTLDDDFEDCRGVYFLMYGNYVTYVGMSNTSIKDRIYGGNLSAGHIYSKVFDNFKYINLSHLKQDEIKTIEGEYIRMFNPKENTIGRDLEILFTDEYLEYIGEHKEKFDNFCYDRAMDVAVRTKKFFNS